MMASAADPAEDSGLSHSTPLCTLRVQVLAARNLTAKDRNGKSDPFVVVSLPGSAVPKSSDGHRSVDTVTSVKPKTLDPVWGQDEATFDFPVLPDWYGPNFATVASDPINSDLVKAAIQNTVIQPAEAESATASDVASTPQKARPRLQLRSASAMKISRSATKMLVAPVKLGAAGARVVGRQMPRPMRLKKHNVDSKTGAALAASAALLADVRPPRGSIQLDASNGMVSSLEFVIWDKDKFSGNDYMGECSLLVPQWCHNGQINWSKSQSVWLPIESSRPNAVTSGELQVKIGFVPLSTPAQPTTGPQSWSVDEVYNRLVLATLGTTGAAIRAVPASQSVGTAGAAEAFIDDGLSSDSEDDDTGSLSDTASAASDVNDDDDVSSDDEGIYDMHYHSIAGPDAHAADAGGQTAPSVADALSPPSHTPGRGGKYRRMFSRNKGVSSGQTSGARTPVTAAGSDVETSQAGTPIDGTRPRRRRLPGVPRRKRQPAAGDSEAPAGTSTKRRRKPGKRRSQRKGGEYAFKAEMGMDIIGIVMMEVKGAHNLPRWSNVTRTGFDMDPFAIASFGQKIFRTRVVRHTLNPTWNEKLLFHVRRHEINFQAKFAIYDWDRMSSNDYVGGAHLDVADLVNAAPKPDPATGLYAADEDGINSMATFDLPLTRTEKDETVKFKGKTPILSLQAKFTPYDALRQKFWRQLAQQFDTNDSATLNRLELSSMLDSLGSTLSIKTLDTFFREVDKNPDEDELTYDQVISALEAEVKKPWAQKRKAVSLSDLQSGPSTPSLAHHLGGVSDIGADVNQEFDFGGSNAPTSDHADTGRPVAPLAHTSDNEAMAKPLPSHVKVSQAKHAPPVRSLSALSISSSASSRFSKTDGSASSSVKPPHRGSSGSSSDAGKVRSMSPSPTPPQITVDRDGDAEEGSEDMTGFDEDDMQPVELVVRLQSCPLCHMPRLSKKGEMDIITHLAVCASQDWRRVESLTVRNYVTASQAQRKWYTKVVNKISQGNYQLGANSANIIVQDRVSGELMEEKMQVYVRLGIRLMYQGARSRMDGARLKRMLKNMSIKQGVKFDHPSSAREIASFIAFHNLSTDEILEPLDHFKTFNEFFYRKLKSDARPNDEPDNPARLVSGADCRMMAFESISEATRLWIKGREFSVARLLGDAAAEVSDMDSYQNGGALSIFRLAPQDYHRFHCPADATVGKFTWIEGQYYTVNPMAIRSTIDVYGENVRVVVPFHSAEFGTFYAVCIGAMMVGSTVLTVKEGDQVKRGQEFGFFKFGGSTIVLVFAKGRMTLDEDLLDNSRAAIETLVSVGMGVGRAVADTD